MSSPSSRDLALEAAADQVAAELADDSERRPGWQRRVLGGVTPQQAVAERPTTVQIHFLATTELAGLMAQVARDQGLNRHRWIRQVLAAEVARVTGRDAAELAGQFRDYLPRGTRKEPTRTPNRPR
jgi:hypothetical protein